MKISFLLLAIGCFAVSCSDNKAAENKEKTATSDTSTTSFAYKVDHEWERGSRENLKVAMLGLKEFENGNIESSLKSFGDTVRIEVDSYEVRVGKDSLRKIFQGWRDEIKSIKINMDDYESVKSTDGKHEYVSLWYKQITENKNGKVDSLECMDDMEMKNGKVVLLNEKTRKYSMQAKK